MSYRKILITAIDVIFAVMLAPILIVLGAYYPLAALALMIVVLVAMYVRSSLRIRRQISEDSSQKKLEGRSYYGRR